MSIVLRFHIWFIMTVYHNATVFYHKMRHKFVIQNAFGFLLQNVSAFYYKMHFATVLLQNNAVFTNWNDCITKCDSYYKMRRLVQIATVQNAYVLNSNFLVFFFKIWILIDGRGLLNTLFYIKKYASKIRKY